MHDDVSAPRRQRKNTLVVLKRYRFLINLPKTLKELIANQEWAHAIQDIKKARETESTMFARVLEEVNVIGEDLRLKLYQKLEELPKPQQELQRFVQWVHLASPFRPVHALWTLFAPPIPWRLAGDGEAPSESLLPHLV